MAIIISNDSMNVGRNMQLLWCNMKDQDIYYWRSEVSKTSRNLTSPLKVR